MSLKKQKYFILFILIAINTALSTTFIIYENKWYIYLFVLAMASLLNSINSIGNMLYKMITSIDYNKIYRQNPNNYVYIIPCYNESKEELEEAYNVIRFLKGKINEVNLLNAKLLYSNKLFRNFTLTEGQKMKVIENFDRAGNTREVKLVFSTLAESFKRPTTKKRVVKESYASKPVRTTAPKTQVLNEGFELANRWKKLAGLL